MPRFYEGTTTQPGEARFAVVVSRFNAAVTEKLLAGALRTFQERGVRDESIDVARVPGAWEIPLIAQRMARTGVYRAVICLGAVIRGETTHDQYINRQVSDSLGRIALEFNLPVLFGVLTCNNLEQALHRAGGKVGNKGSDCVEAALEMVNLLTKLS
jgi:6,7-dimethyl-8-ribityllumazine synthase